MPCLNCLRDVMKCNSPSGESLINSMKELFLHGYELLCKNEQRFPYNTKLDLDEQFTLHLQEVIEYQNKI